MGGTSAVAPLMAALITRISELKKRPVGFTYTTLYGDQATCRDSTQEDNITTSTLKGYKAAHGWDACTGWGILSGL